MIIWYIVQAGSTMMVYIVTSSVDSWFIVFCVFLLTTSYFYKNVFFQLNENYLIRLM